MIGILIVAHGSLGESLIQCATHVMGIRPPNLEQFGIEKNDDPCAVVALLEKAVKNLDQGDGEIGRAHV